MKTTASSFLYLNSIDRRLEIFADFPSRPTSTLPFAQEANGAGRNALKRQATVTKSVIITPLVVNNDSMFTPVKIPSEKSPESHGIFALFWLGRSGLIDKVF